MKLRGVGLLPPETAPPAKKSINTSRSFPVSVSRYEELKESVSLSTFGVWIVNSLPAHDGIGSFPSRAVPQRDVRRRRMIHRRGRPRRAARASSHSTTSSPATSRP